MLPVEETRLDSRKSNTIETQLPNTHYFLWRLCKDCRLRTWKLEVTGIVDDCINSRRYIWQDGLEGLNKRKLNYYLICFSNILDISFSKPFR